MAGESLTLDVGVLIAAYNADRWVGQALGSVAMQSCPPRTVLVVDDGSADNTAAAVMSWSRHIPDLRLVRSPRNEGLWAARNKGLALLDTEVVALLDADDYWFPDHLEALAAHYRGRDTLVSPNALRWLPDRSLGHRGWQRRRPIPRAEQQLTRLTIENFVFVGCMFDRERALGVGGFNPLPLGCEDWDLWLRMVAAGVEIVGSSQPTAVYRLRPDSMSADDRILDTEIYVLESYRQRATDRRTLRGVRTGLRHRRARIAMRNAYALVERRDFHGARRAAWRAMSGSRRLLPRAAAMVLAPRIGLRVRGFLHDKTSWLTRQ